MSTVINGYSELKFKEDYLAATPEVRQQMLARNPNWGADANGNLTLKSGWGSFMWNDPKKNVPIDINAPVVEPETVTTTDAGGNAVTTGTATNPIPNGGASLDGNSITGGYGIATGEGAFGTTQNGITTSGWVAPAYKLGMSAWNAYQSYQALEETQKQNAAKISLANEGIYMKRTDQHNKIAKQRRNQQMGLGNANNTAYMTQIAAANPYKTYREYAVPYSK